ncbi:unnamed protein product [Durusdinium trenchii]
MAAIPHWTLAPDGTRISLCLVAKNWGAAMKFLNQVGELAEAEGHHPDLHLTSYRTVQVDLFTHAIGGLSLPDFVLAAKIDAIELRSSVLRCEDHSMREKTKRAARWLISVFEFETPHLVIFKDWRLTMLQMTFTFSVAVYVVVKSLLLWSVINYEEIAAGFNSWCFTSWQSTPSGPDSPHCQSNSSFDLAPLNPMELGGLEAFNHSCPSVTGAGIMRQVGAEAQITVWKQRRRTSSGCSSATSSSAVDVNGRPCVESFFMNGVEDLPLFLIHTVSATGIGITRSLLPCKIVSPDGVILDYANPGENNNGWAFTLRKLLQYAGNVSLDNLNQGNVVEVAPGTLIRLRHTGFILTLRFRYWNYKSWPEEYWDYQSFPWEWRPSEPQCSLEVELQPQAWGFVGADEEPEGSVLRSVARIQFVGSGQFGELSWLLVVTSLIEAFVLMGIASSVTLHVARCLYGDMFRQVTETSYEKVTTQADAAAQTRSSRMMGRNRTSAFQQTKPNSGSQLDLTNAPLQEVTISNGLSRRTLHLLWHLAKVPDVPKFDGETLLQSYLECRFLGLSNVEALTTLGGSSPLQLIQAAELWSEGDPEVSEDRVDIESGTLVLPVLEDAMALLPPDDQAHLVLTELSKRWRLEEFGFLPECWGPFQFWSTFVFPSGRPGRSTIGPIRIRSRSRRPVLRDAVSLTGGDDGKDAENVTAKNRALGSEIHLQPAGQHLHAFQSEGGAELRNEERVGTTVTNTSSVRYGTHFLLPDGLLDQCNDFRSGAKHLGDEVDSMSGGTNNRAVCSRDGTMRFQQHRDGFFYWRPGHETWTAQQVAQEPRVGDQRARFEVTCAGPATILALQVQEARKSRIGLALEDTPGHRPLDACFAELRKTSSLDVGHSSQLGLSSCVPCDQHDEGGVSEERKASSDVRGPGGPNWAELGFHIHSVAFFPYKLGKSLIYEDLLASFTNLRSLIEGPRHGLEDAEEIPRNKEPKARAELFLAVGFGSLVEEEEERGIAHIIEHLGFSATKAYENHAIVKFLESIGAPFGACQNAYTSFDRTVYTLHVPTDKEGLVEESLKVLREFAYFTRISEEDLDKERKVVLEEWRESRNAQGRLSERYIQALCGAGCRWCERLPIGKEEVIRGVSAETLRKFYQKFYHPAQMAIIAVGDFDEEMVQQKIKELFDLAPSEIDPLPRQSEAPGRPRYAVPDSEGVRVASSTDPELSFAQSMVDCKRPRLPAKTVRDVRRRMTEDLFHRALSSRLLRLTLQGPLEGGARDFFSAATESSDPLPALNNLCASLAPLPGRVRPALRSMLRELERLRRFGFHRAEVRRAQRAMLAEFEEDYIEREQRPSESFAEEFTSLFLDEDCAPGVVERARLAAHLLPGISPDEVSSVAKLYDFTKNVVVKIATPLMSVRSPAYTCWSVMQACRQMSLPRPSLDLPGEEEVAQIMKSVTSEQMEAWPPDADDPEERLRNLFEGCAEELLPPSRTGTSRGREVRAEGVPKPSRKEEGSMEVSEEAFGEEVILQNGLRIFLKETDLFDDEILLRGRRWGGLSEFQENGMFSGGISCEAQVNQMCAMMLGICGLPAESLQECLEGKRVDPNPPSMEAYTTSMDASSSPADFEVLLMLVALLFVRPVPSSASAGRLSLVKLGLLAWRLAEDRDPQSQFRRRVLSAVSSNHPYTWLPSLWRILRLNFKTAAQIFNERASQPREWTFVLTGKLPKKEKLMTLLETYLGSIPNRDGSNERCDDLTMRESVKSLEIHFPTKSVQEDVHLRMVEPKGSTVLCFPLQMSSSSCADSLEKMRRRAAGADATAAFGTAAGDTPGRSAAFSEGPGLLRGRRQ